MGRLIAQERLLTNLHPSRPTKYQLARASRPNRLAPERRRLFGVRKSGSIIRLIKPAAFYVIASKGARACAPAHHIALDSRSARPLFRSICLMIAPSLASLSQVQAPSQARCATAAFDPAIGSAIAQSGQFCARIE